MMTESKDRFPSLTEEDLESIQNESKVESTVKAMKFWSSVFLEYLREKKTEIDLKTCSAEKLAKVLKKLYAEVRRKDGSFYQRTSLRGLRAGIRHHIMDPPFSRKDLSLFRDHSAFDDANNLLEAQLKVFKKRGEQKATSHYPPISEDDLKKLGSFLRKTIADPEIDPTNLTLASWFILTYHLGLRKREFSWACASKTWRFR